MSLFNTAPQALSMWAMLGGGLVAFVSPCVLPMLPVYAVYLVGGQKSYSTRWDLFRRCLGLASGFVLLFTLMGAGAGAIGGALKNADRGTLNLITGLFMILFGLWMMEIIHIHLNAKLPRKLNRFHPTMNGFWGSFAFGLLLAISWTPCLTPVLANALMLAASADNATMLAGMKALAVFSLGLCLPMLAVMLLYQWLKGVLGWLRDHQHLIRRIAGVLMAVYGLYMVIAALV